MPEYCVVVTVIQTANDVDEAIAFVNTNLGKIMEPDNFGVAAVIGALGSETDVYVPTV